MRNRSYSLVFHNEIESQLKSAYDWYEVQEPGLQARFADELAQQLDKIVAAPETYGEKSRKGFREVSLKSFPYTVVYKIHRATNIIFVNSIHHHKQHPKKKFRK